MMMRISGQNDTRSLQETRQNSRVILIIIGAVLCARCILGRFAAYKAGAGSSAMEIVDERRE